MHTIMKRHIESMMDETTIFITPIGSRLYGLENAESDYDYLKVTTRLVRKNTHSVRDEFDIRVFSWFSLFEMLMKKPTHTGYEALMSPAKVYGPMADQYMPFLNSYRPGMSALLKTFISAALGTLTVKDEDKFKRFRLGLLLAKNFNEACENEGRYNPTLTSREAAELTARAEELFARPEDDRPDIIREAFGMY